MGQKSGSLHFSFIVFQETECLTNNGLNMVDSILVCDWMIGNVSMASLDFESTSCAISIGAGYNKIYNRTMFTHKK